MRGLFSFIEWPNRNVIYERLYETGFRLQPLLQLTFFGYTFASSLKIIEFVEKEKSNMISQTGELTKLTKDEVYRNNIEDCINDNDNKPCVTFGDNTYEPVRADSIRSDDETVVAGSYRNNSE